jgi:hypothetical protein
MYVIGFLYISLSTSTVQLHDSLGRRHAYACSEAGFSSQNGDRAWGVYYRSAAFCVFLWAKGLNTKDIHKEMFPVCGGKCLSHKAVHNWVANVSLMTRLKRRCGSGSDKSRKTSMLRVSKHWLRDGTCLSILEDDMSRNKCLCIISICDLFTDSPSYNMRGKVYSCFLGLYTELQN